MHTLLGSICCMQTYFYLEEVSRHFQSYLLRSATSKITGKYLYTTIAHERKRTKKIPTYLFKILTCSIIWCLQISSRLDCMTLAFENYFSAHHKLLPLPRRRKKTFIERKQLFATDEKVWSLSSTRREISSSQNRKHSHTHSLTHTHTHTQDDCYTLAC